MIESAEWRDVEGWPYQVSNDGLVRNKRTGRILKTDTIKGGYLRVTMSSGGITSRRPVHLLVCETFNGPRPADATCARHRNGRSNENSSGNLLWGTHSDNEQDKKLHGTYQSRERNPASKLTETAVADIRRRQRDNLAKRKLLGFKRVERGFILSLAEEYRVSASCIKLVVSGRNWPEKNK